MLIRPVGRPSNTPVVWYAEFQYQAKSWERASVLSEKFVMKGCSPAF